jgi:Zn-dependent oligopeptidase
MSVSQKEAVYNAIKSIKSFDDGELVTLTKEEKANVVQIVVAAFEAGEVSLSDAARAKFDDSTKLSKYTSGMVNNWLRKDTRLNGGSKYVTKNPGSRAGSQDDTIKNLRLLKSTLTDETQIAEVDAAIEQRKSEIQAEKAKNVEINFDHIPESLRATLGL